VAGCPVESEGVTVLVMTMGAPSEGVTVTMATVPLATGFLVLTSATVLLVTPPDGNAKGVRVGAKTDVGCVVMFGLLVTFIHGDDADGEGWKPVLRRPLEGFLIVVVFDATGMNDPDAVPNNG
jgi:hypothetical protein